MLFQALGVSVADQGNYSDKELTVSRMYTGNQEDMRFRGLKSSNSSVPVINDIKFTKDFVDAVLHGDFDIGVLALWQKQIEDSNGGILPKTRSSSVTRNTH